MSSNDVVLCSALRSPIGRFQGTLSAVRPDDLLARLFEAVIADSDLDASQIDEVFAGCANQAGEDNRNIARMSTLLAGIPQHVPAVTVNRLCASGLESVVQAYRSAKCGDGQLFLAGGVESMSRAPYVMPRGPQMPKAGNLTTYDTSLGWRFPNPKMEAMFPLEAMGCTAENIVDEMGITREAQDIFALGSHTKALKAQANGVFDNEIVSISIPQRERTPSSFKDDDHVLIQIGKLVSRAAFVKVDR